MPARIDKAEREREATYLSLSDPQLLRDGIAVAAARTRVVAFDVEIAKLTERWEALETLAAG